MAGNRTLKLSILADVDNLRKSLNQADGDVKGFGGKLDEWGKKAGLAFAAAGAAAAAYAGKLAIDGVKAAIEDEAAQKRLATTLENVTGATKGQIAAIEDYILKTSLAFGVTDDDLRPSLDRLTRSTKSVTEAQKLQALALNISAGTGKDLQSVSEALAKAYDGNFGALKRLGVSLDESIIKNKDFNGAVAALSNTFKDQANIQADTFDGKMRRLNIAFNEAKESVGSFILDAITPLVNKFSTALVPAFQDTQAFVKDYLIPIFKEIYEFTKNLFTPIIDGLTEAFAKVTNAFKDNKSNLEPLINVMRNLWNFTKDYLAPFIGGALKVAFSTLGSVIAGVVNTVSRLVDIVTTAFNALKKLIDLVRNNPLTRGIGDLFGSSAPSAPNGFTGNPNIRNSGAPVNNITVNGAIDPISTARQIANILNIEATQSGSFKSLGGNLAYQA